MLTGIDFSFGGGVTVAQIKAAGYQFACRYLSGGNAKDISAAEVANYKAGNMPVVFVWETTGNEFTFAQGAQEAKAAVAELAQVGAPGATVFFAQDVPVAAGANPVAYMQGVNSVIGKERSGGYGQYSVIKALFDAGVIRYGWQTSGGSAGQWDLRALLRQNGFQLKVGPATCDLDQAAFWASAKILGTADDFGQWPRPAAPAPVPPAPAPNPKHQAGTVRSDTTGGSAKVTSDDAGWTWNFGGTVPRGAFRWQTGTVHSDQTGATALVVSDDGGGTWHYAGTPQTGGALWATQARRQVRLVAASAPVIGEQPKAKRPRRPEDRLPGVQPQIAQPLPERRGERGQVIRHGSPHRTCLPGEQPQPCSDSS